MAICLALSICAIYLVSWHLARGGRIFFSPDTLESKSQSEILLYMTEIPIYRSSYHFDCTDLAKHLIEKGYWSPISPSNPRWLLGVHWNNQWHGGNARFYREIASYGTEYIEWSNNHPELAKYLWPRILRILRTQPDIANATLADLLYRARHSSSFDELKAIGVTAALDTTGITSR